MKINDLRNYLKQLEEKDIILYNFEATHTKEFIELMKGNMTSWVDDNGYMWRHSNVIYFEIGIGIVYYDIPTGKITFLMKKTLKNLDDLDKLIKKIND